MTRCWLIEGRGDDFALNRPLHIRHFLWSLINKENQQVDFGIVRSDTVRNALQHHGFTRAGWGGQQRTLALTNGCHQIDNATGHVLVITTFNFQLEALFWVKRCQVVKVDTMLGLFGLFIVDFCNALDGEIAFLFTRSGDLAFHKVARAQRKFPDQRRLNVDVRWACQIIGFGAPQKTKAITQDL